MTMLGDDEINRRFGFHPATAETIPMFEDTRTRAIALARHWDETLPDGREKALAITALQEAAMYANAAVACNLSPLEDPATRQPNPLTEQLASDAMVRIPSGRPARGMAAPRPAEPSPRAARPPGRMSATTRRPLGEELVTTRARLCDDAGMVSDQPVDRIPWPGAEELTYRGQLNNLRAHTGLEAYAGAPFPCTSSGHLAGMELRCTSPAHSRPESWTPPSYPAVLL